MKNNFIKNLTITVICLVAYFFGGYITEGSKGLERAWNMYSLDFLLKILFSIIFGIAISFPLKLRNRNNEITFDWTKFILQGIPAFILAIPFTIIVMLFMRLKNISILDLGIFNSFIKFQTKELYLHVLAGVWFGKVIADCFGVDKDIPIENKNSTFV